MSMNPIETTKTIEGDYLAYLQSILAVKDNELTKKAYQALAENKFVKGPYLEATPPFVQGKTLSKLINEKVASEEFHKIAKAVEIDRPLYVHQEAAFRKVVTNHRNIIVATGTGSGKTECFMYPIFNELMLQNIAGKLNDGVRALFLYPMNALANDQMKRLRGLLAKYPDITFGRYTGETLESDKKALEVYKEKKERDIKAKNKNLIKGIDYNDDDLDPLPNERISRESIRRNPPHILLTNYAMLEYLLIRPEDTTLFDGICAKAWRFIVLDEAHTYKGANGTEIALLLRRLKERVCENKKNIIQCIATSATLGNKDAFPQLAAFATDIFDEIFEVEDIVTSERKKRAFESGMKKFTIAEYGDFKNNSQTMCEEERGPWLHERLVKDERIINVLKMLETKPKNLSDVAKQVFEDYSDNNEKERGLILLIELGVMAKPDMDSVALLPARYHLFVRALEGVYIALYPEKRVFLDRKEIFDVGEFTVPVFELSNCQNCGQEYLIGKEKNEFLKPAIEGEKLDYYMLTNEVVDTDDVDIDDDDEAIEKADVKKVQAYELCTICGKLSLARAKRREGCCPSNDNKKIIKVYKMLTNTRDVNTCAACGSISNAIIKRFMTANQPATYIVANSLYTMIPPQKIDAPSGQSKGESFFDFDEDIKNTEYYDECGRKLLVFSDNRQEAAFFAAYMDNKYNQLMWRRLILRELRNKPEGLLLGDLIPILVMKAKEASLFPEIDDLSNMEKENIAGTYLFKEYMGHERKQGLEGRGYIKFAPEKIAIKNGRWGFSADEIWTLCTMIMDTLRLSGATTYPDNIDPENENFQPRNRNVYFRKEESGKYRSSYIASFLPVGSANNKRFDYIKKILESTDIEKVKAKEKGLVILNSMYDIILELSRKGYFTQENVGTEGILTRINYKKWIATYYNEDDKVFSCKRCGKITAHNIRNICPQFRCKGLLEELSAKEFRNDPYYSKAYNQEKLIPMISREHTAQLNKDTASTIQTKFENGEVNVLSCSTTFEMGVDVGQLEAILLRNVPPETTNYIQRAGRAGRRTSATAFCVTYAKRSSHDLNYYANPSEIISGKIKSPYIEMSNDKIAGRHINSIVLAWFFRKHEGYFKGKVRALTGSDGRETVVEVLKRELDNRPLDLIESIQRVLPIELNVRLGIKKWSFVDKLVGEDGSLTNAIKEKQRDFEDLNEVLKKRNETLINGRKQYSDDIVRLINTFEEQQTINFLASSGVIPKYGFPVDVVKLDIRNNTAEAKEVDLSRDLKMAISEYAPGSEVIAAGKIWTSHSINKIRDKEWPTYRYFECSDCKRTTLSAGVTTLEESDDEKVESCTCGKQMKAHKFIIPIFGFSTSWIEKAKKVGESRPKRFYPTKVQFGGIEALDSYQEKERKDVEIHIADNIIDAMYSPQGKLVLMNKGSNDAGLFICKYCGYAQAVRQDFTHKNRMGNDCPSKYPIIAALGHVFTSDILRLEFPIRYVKQVADHDQWATLLYAILEGASDALGISRDDINGCLDRSGIHPAIILFDEAAGGAGHVKRIYLQLETVLKAAYCRVDGHCGCGEETTCYGCLRSYGNQMEHDILARGMAKEYLEWILLERTDSNITYVPKDINKKKKKETNIAYKNKIEISAEWKNALKLLMNPDDDPSYKFAMELIENGVSKVPDEIGYEIRSEQYGVLGYEAEMVWHEKKIALLLNNDDVEVVQKFTESGWMVYVISDKCAKKLADELR